MIAPPIGGNQIRQVSQRYSPNATRPLQAGRSATAHVANDRRSVEMAASDTASMVAVPRHRPAIRSAYDDDVSASTYPAHLAVDVVLRDGSTVHIRPARVEDTARVQDYFIGLSDDSRHLRFWSPSVDITEQSRRTVDVDHVDHLTLLAFLGDEMVGGAQCFRDPASARAEVAMSVSDEFQGHGLGSILIGHLAQAAREVGITTFAADVLPENHRMIGVFRDSGFNPTIRSKPGVVEVTFPTAITAETMEQFEDRERFAAAAAVHAFLQPTSVAVIGASRDPETIGGRLFHNLVAQPFAGVVYPVHPSAQAVQGVRAYASVNDVPGDVGLAFIAVPAAVVNDVAEECGRKGVRALVVISSGFGETDEVGVARQKTLVETCRAFGMRLIGPNCMGIANTDPDIRLNGTFAAAWPPAGNVGFMSQSGALGLAVMNQASALGMGLSTFVSVGNKADVSANDLLCYWDEDPRTDVVLLYLESFGNPRRFGRLARRIGPRKPIVAVKSGRSVAGARATSSHTGALLAANDRTVDAVFRQHGVIRTDTLEEMFDVATLLANQPVPTGRNVAIVTNAGGLAIQCADMCEARGLQVPELSSDTIVALRSWLPPEASPANPVDMIASATPRALRTCDPRGRRRPHDRRGDRDLHPAARARRATGRRGDRRGDREPRATDPRADVFHVRPGRPRGVVSARRTDPLLRISGTGCDRPGARDRSRVVADATRRRDPAAHRHPRGRGARRRRGCVSAWRRRVAYARRGQRVTGLLRAAERPDGFRCHR